MIKYLQNLIIVIKSSVTKRLSIHSRALNISKMAGEASKIKSEFPITKPAKRIKVSDDLIINKRTVGTMCGAWRPEEEDGGLILVFKTREPCLSPDPEKESDRPENAEDFWVASPSDIDDIQVSLRHFIIIFVVITPMATLLKHILTIIIYFVNILTATSVMFTKNYFVITSMV